MCAEAPSALRTQNCLHLFIDSNACISPGISELGVNLLDATTTPIYHCLQPLLPRLAISPPSRHAQRLLHAPPGVCITTWLVFAQFTECVSRHSSWPLVVSSPRSCQCSDYSACCCLDGLQCARVASYPPWHCLNCASSCTAYPIIAQVGLVPFLNGGTHCFAARHNKRSIVTNTSVMIRTAGTLEPRRIMQSPDKRRKPSCRRLS